MQRVAFDTETVSPSVPIEEYPDFEDPTDFEFQSAAIAIEDDGDHVETHHLTRDGWGPEPELALIREILDTFEDLSPGKILTYNGDRFDFWLLQERARLAGQSVDDLDTYTRAQSIANRLSHHDLKHPAWARWGNYTTLEETLVKAGVFDTKRELQAAQTRLSEFDHGYDYEAWSWKDPTDGDIHLLDSTDVAYLGEEALDGRGEGRDDPTFNALEAMLDDYVRGDVAHLFALANTLDD